MKCEKCDFLAKPLIFDKNYKKHWDEITQIINSDMFTSCVNIYIFEKNQMK